MTPTRQMMPGRHESEDEYNEDVLRLWLSLAQRARRPLWDATKWVLICVGATLAVAAVGWFVFPADRPERRFAAWCAFLAWPFALGLLTTLIGWHYVFIYRIWRMEAAVSRASLQDIIRRTGEKAAANAASGFARDRIRAHGVAVQDELDHQLRHLQHCELALQGMDGFRSLVTALVGRRISRIVVFDDLGAVASPADPAAFGRSRSFQSVLHDFVREQRKHRVTVSVERRYYVRPHELEGDATIADAHWQRNSDLVLSLFWNTNPDHKCYWHPCTDSPLQHTVVLGSACADLLPHTEAKSCTEIFFFSGDEADPLLRMHSPAVVRGERFSSALVLTNIHANAGEYARLMQWQASTYRAAEIDENHITKGMFNHFSRRLRALTLIEKPWEKTTGPVFALDLSMLQNNLDAWASDSFYQLALDWNRKVLRRWQSQRGLSDTDQRFVRIFVLRRDQVHSLLTGVVAMPTGRRVSKAGALDEIWGEQADLGIDVRAAILEDLTDMDLMVRDFNYVRDQHVAVELRVEYDHETKQLAFYPFHAPQRWPDDTHSVADIELYWTAFMEGEPKVQSWPYALHGSAEALLVAMKDQLDRP